MKGLNNFLGNQTVTTSVEIFGETPQAELVELISFDILKYLMPRTTKDIDVEIHFIDKCDGQVAGDCYGDRNEAFINIAKGSYNYKYSFNEQFLTLCHELVHAKQFIKGELSGNGSTWHGVDMHLINNIKDQPWEQEAFKLEVELYNKYIKMFKRIL